MTDLEFVLFKVSIEGESKMIAAYAYTAPEWFRNLRREIVEVAYATKLATTLKPTRAHSLFRQNMLDALS